MNIDELNDNQWADVPDMLDSEVVKMRRILEQLRYKYAMRINNYHNLQEFAKEAKERMLAEIGWVCDIDLLPCIQIDPATMTAGAPVISFIRRLVPLEEFDHEQKRYEVLKSKERGEDLLGQRGKTG